MIVQYVKQIKLNNMLLRVKYAYGKNVRKVKDIVKTCL